MYLLILMHFSPAVANSNVTTNIDTTYQKGKDLYRKGNYIEALSMFNESLQNSKEIYGEISVSVGNIYSYLGLIYKVIGETDQAIEYYKKAENTYKQIENIDLIKIAITHNQLATLYRLSNDYKNAISYLKNAERLIVQNNLSNKNVSGSVYINLSETYSMLKDSINAFYYLNKSKRYYSKDTREINKKRIEGSIYARLENYTEALRVYNSALDLYNQCNVDDKKLKSTIYNDIGYSYLQISDFDNSLKYFELAYNMFSEHYGSKNRFASTMLNNIGSCYTLKADEAFNAGEIHKYEYRKHIQEALNYIQKSIFAVIIDFNNEDILDNPEISNSLNDVFLLRALKNKAETLKKLAHIEKDDNKKEKEIKYLSKALETYELALDLINKIRNSFLSAESRVVLAENEKSTHFKTCDIAVTLYELTNESEYLEKAFQISERGKSASLLAALGDMKALDFGGIPDSLLNKEHQLKREIAAYNNLLFAEYESIDTDSVKTALLENKVFNLERRYSELINHFENEYPEYYYLRYSDKTITIEEVQKNIPENQSIVEYILKEPQNGKDGEIISFLITKESCLVRRTKVDSSFNNNIEEFLSFLKEKDPLYTTVDDFANYSRAANSLYNILFKPLEKDIKTDRVVFVQEGILTNLPMEVLLGSMPDTTTINFQDINYLLNDYAVSYSYSATLLYKYFRPIKIAPKSFLGIAPDYSEDNNLKTDNAYESTPAPLAGAKNEVETVSEMINGENMSNTNTASYFKGNAGKYDILHLATHTAINDSLPMYSKMVFNSIKDSSNYGQLNTYEIYNMKFNARMAVLSGCNSGSGYLYKSEGTMSLARAFMYSGCPSIIMTLWSVADKSSAAIMIAFYRNLLQGKTKDIALREAKIEYLQSLKRPINAHPVYWQGFVSIGDQSSLFPSFALYIKPKQLALIIFTLLLFLIIRLSATKRDNHS